jgi:hypothetical protein
MGRISLQDLEAKLESLPGKRRETLETATALLLGALLDERPRELEAFVSSGESASPARLKNRARLTLLSARVQQQSIRGSDLGRQLGVSRQRLQQLREAGKLLGVQPPLRSEHWYPAWQFGDDGRVREVVPRLLASAREAGLSPLQLHLLMTNAEAGVDGRPLVDLLDSQPDEALEVVEGSGEIGS